jgi:hypothetical protein
VLFGAAFIAFSSGCSRDAEKSLDHPAGSVGGNAFLNGELDSLKKEIHELKATLAKVQELQTKVESLESSNQQYRIAWFDPTAAQSFGRVDANVGYFLIALERVEPYLDGQKVTLLIGNPNNVTFQGFEINASWRIRRPTEGGKGSWGEWANSHREKVVKFTEALRPGIWNKVSFTIAPVTVEQLGNLGIAITTNQVLLAGGR